MCGAGGGGNGGGTGGSGGDSGGSGWCLPAARRGARVHGLGVRDRLLLRTFLVLLDFFAVSNGEVAYGWSARTRTYRYRDGGGKRERKRERGGGKEGGR